jgi:hypothetical protein
MITHAIAFAAGVVAAVISPPLYAFAAAKVAQFNAWRATKEF